MIEEIHFKKLCSVASISKWRWFPRPDKPENNIQLDMPPFQFLECNVYVKARLSVGKAWRFAGSISLGKRTELAPCSNYQGAQCMGLCGWGHHSQRRKHQELNSMSPGNSVHHDLCWANKLPSHITKKKNRCTFGCWYKLQPSRANWGFRDHKVGGL